MTDENKSNFSVFGSWAFIIGVVLALIIGVFSNFLNPET